MRLVPLIPTIMSVFYIFSSTGAFAKAQALATTVYAVSPNGVNYAKSTADNLVEIRNRNQPVSTQPLITLLGPKERITALTFTSDGAFLAGACDDRHVYIWRLSDGRSIGQLTEPDDPLPEQKRVSHVAAIAFNPAGSELGLVDDGFRWLVRFTGTGPADLSRRDAIVTSAPLLSIAADGHGGWVAGDGIGCFHFYDPLLTQLSATSSLVAGAIRSMVVSPDGLLLATGDDSKQIKIWFFGSAATASQAGHFGLKERYQAKSTVVSLEFLNDSKTLLYADSASDVSTWIVPGNDTIAASVAPPATVAGTPTGAVLAQTASAGTPTNPAATVAGAGGTPAAGGVPPQPASSPVTGPPATAPPTTSQPPPPTIPPTKAATAGSSVPPTQTPGLVQRDPSSISPASKPDVKPTTSKAPSTTVAALPEDHRVTVHIALTKSLVGHSDYVNTVAFSRDGQFIASGSRDKTVRLWDVNSGNQRIIGKHDGYVSCVAFSPEEELLASGGWDDHIKLFQMPAGTPKDEAGKLDHHTSYVLSLAFSPDGKLLADGSNDKTARVFSFATGLSKSTPAMPDGIAVVAFSPDGKRIAGGCLDGNVYIWDATTMALVRKLPGNSKTPVFCLAYLDNNALVCAGRGGTMHVWRVATGNLIKTVQASAQDIFGLAYSPTNHLVATGGTDRIIKIWNGSELDQPGKPVAPLTMAKEHTNTVRTIAFSADGKTMASGSWDDNILVWDVKSNAGSSANTAMLTSGQEP